jgi:ATP-dependent Lon protease
MTTIGLFPLRIVLFPGSSYPLHIFEERYKTLVSEAIERDGEFGINLVENRRVHPIGCGARVSKLITTYDDGKMDIIVTGTDRYEITEFHVDAQPYLVADVEPLLDTDPELDTETLRETIVLYNSLVEMVYGEAETKLIYQEWLDGGAAFRMAQKSGLDLPLRQGLLEMRSENERLKFLRDYFTGILPKIRQAELLQSLVRNDGYVKPPNSN